jgi:orotate phosphoribosyltransferase
MTLLDPQRARLLRLLTELSFQEREVTLSSGKKSNFYIDCKQTALHAEGHFLIGQLGREVIDREAPEARAVGGMTLGADPIASAISLMSFVAGRPLHGFIVRKEAKGHGTGQWIEGMTNLEPNMPVVIVEDVVTTGGSTLRAIERARQAELRVVRVLALVDREEGGREAIEAEVPLSTLFVKRDFLS